MHIRIVRNYEVGTYMISVVNNNKRIQVLSATDKESARQFADELADCLECAIFEGPEGFTNIVRRAK
jgi:uncharacterized membrane protein